MQYKRSLARETLRQAIEVEKQIRAALTTCSSDDRPVLLRALTAAHNLQRQAEERIEASDRQQARRHRSSTDLLPAPRSNHEGA